MLSSILKKRSMAVKISTKSAISLLMIVLAVALPQFVHIVGGASAGAVWLPMYAPGLLAGCILGWRWGLGVGIISPLVSFAFTSLAFGNAMPSLERLPYMVAELAVFGLVSGAFSNGIFKNVWLAFPAVLTAQISGRAVYVVYNLVAGREFTALWASVQSGLNGLYLQIFVVPFIVILLMSAVKRGHGKE